MYFSALVFLCRETFFISFGISKPQGNVFTLFFLFKILMSFPMSLSLFVNRIFLTWVFTVYFKSTS